MNLLIRNHKPTPKRQEVRATFGVNGKIRRGFSRAEVKILDINTRGAKYSTCDQFHYGDNIWLTLPTLEPIEAFVRWADKFIVGCEFRRPLHPSVLVHILMIKQKAELEHN